MWIDPKPFFRRWAPKPPRVTVLQPIAKIPESFCEANRPVRALKLQRFIVSGISKGDQVSKRVSHSFLDPVIGPRLKSLYPHLRIPHWFPPEAIVLTGHGLAILGAVGFAVSTQFWWGGLLAALGVVGNHVADCVDGTHARATGQCRNGGELLDHFTDPLSFVYWLVGIGFAAQSLELALVAVICLFAIAILTNIKAKLIGEFTLASFGPTEFKTLLFVLGLVLAGCSLFAEVTVATVALVALAALTTIGVFLVPIQLVHAVRQVNLHGEIPDQSEWITR